jgi:precorrin-6B C5,15-methyltransferase / cobalt-precorrin-6B C5,C15-methyltransferase
MSPGPWLSIIGVGEDGAAGFSQAARSLLQAAELVAGGKRHLQLAGALARNPRPWPSPIDAGVAEVLAMRGQPVVVLASGDPFEHGVGALLVRNLAPGEWISLPQPSAFSLAANRLGWALQDTLKIGLNGRALERLIPLLQPGARILALSADAQTPPAVARVMTQRGFGPSRLTVMEALGGPRESIRPARAQGFDLAAINPLNTLAIEVMATPQARIVPLTPGLPDDWFESDGQLTKREVRALTIAALAPRHGEHLWDLGCGSGSIAIEWMLADRSCTASGIERRADRAARAARNAIALGVPGLRIETGEIAPCLARLDPPQAVFIGGGAREAGLIEGVWAALPSGGRMVVNAVTLGTEALVLAHYAEMGGRLTRIAIDRADPVGGLTGWRPAMPVMQWLVVKP